MDWTSKKINWKRLVVGVVLLISLLDVFLLANVTWRHFRIQRLIDEEQGILYLNFPPLSEEQREEIIGEIFPDFTRIETAIHGKIIGYRVFRVTTLLGYAYQVREDIPCPVCEDVRYFVGLGPENTILDIVLVDNFHLYGKPLPAIEHELFLMQFLNRRIDDSSYSNEEIKGITGATKTTQRFVDGLQGVKAIHGKESTVR